MARRRNRYHLIRNQPDAASQNYVSWCGEESLSRLFMTSSPTDPRLCPKCSSKYAADQLKQNPNGIQLGERLDLTAPQHRKLQWAYKSIYPILALENVLIGHLTIKNGWGEHWHINALTANTDAANTEQSPVYQIAVGNMIERREWLSKEAALIAVPALMTDGSLKTEASILADAKDVHERFRISILARETRTNQLATERTEVMDGIKTGFSEILGRKDLSNLQRAALFDAAKLLGVTIAIVETT